MSLIRKFIIRRKKKRRNILSVTSKCLVIKRRYKLLQRIFLIRSSLLFLKILTLNNLFFNYMFYYLKIKENLLVLFGYLKVF
jgi:hypothetical protein